MGLLDQTLTDALTLVPIGVFAIGLFAISVQLYFQTGSFLEEYKDKVNALRVQANNQIASRIEEIFRLRQSPKPVSGAILPIPIDDLTEQLLSEIRRIGADADEWQSQLAKGKIHIRNAAALLSIIAAIIAFMLFSLALKTGLDPILIMEYAAGIPAFFLAYSLFRFRAIQTKLDNARVG
jgi:hypothetical protein